LKRIPLSVWACDRSLKIVLWSGACAQIYGIPATAALGQDFPSLFVDPVEEAQAREDCLSIIEDDRTFDNFLAFDHTPTGERRTVLTNCFRVWDEERHEFLQAEIGLEISDLQLRENEHRTLREAGVARLEQGKKLLDLLKSDMFARLNAAGMKRERHIEHKLEQVEESRVELKRKHKPEDNIEALLGPLSLEWENEAIEVERMRAEIMRRAIAAQTPEDLDLIEPELARLSNIAQKVKG
jgi:hypothetical protein